MMIFIVASFWGVDAIAQINESKAQVYEYSAFRRTNDSMAGSIMCQTDEQGDTIRWAYCSDTSNQFHGCISVIYDAKEQMIKDFQDLHDKFQTLSEGKEYSFSDSENRKFEKTGNSIVMWCSCHVGIGALFSIDRIDEILTTLKGKQQK